MSKIGVAAAVAVAVIAFLAYLNSLPRYVVYWHVQPSAMFPRAPGLGTAVRYRAISAGGKNITKCELSIKGRMARRACADTQVVESQVRILTAPGSSIADKCGCPFDAAYLIDGNMARDALVFLWPSLPSGAAVEGCVWYPGTVQRRDLSVTGLCSEKVASCQYVPRSVAFRKGLWIVVLLGLVTLGSVIGGLRRVQSAVEAAM